MWVTCRISVYVVSMSEVGKDSQYIPSPYCTKRRLRIFKRGSISPYAYFISLKDAILYRTKTSFNICKKCTYVQYTLVRRMRQVILLLFNVKMCVMYDSIEHTNLWRIKWHQIEVYTCGTISNSWFWCGISNKHNQRIISTRRSIGSHVEIKGN